VLDKIGHRFVQGVFKNMFLERKTSPSRINRAGLLKEKGGGLGNFDGGVDKEKTSCFGTGD